MKKVIIIGALAFLAYTYRDKIFGKKDDVENETLPENENPAIESNDVFVKYNDQVIVDKEGYWMLVKDGKLFTPISLETLQAWQKQNPDKPSVVELKESVWLLYNQTNYGGTF